MINKEILANSLLAQARMCLAELIDSAELDATQLAHDCLERFIEFDWDPKPDLSEEDRKKWDELYNKGVGLVLEHHELTEFFELTEPNGQNHIYFYRVQARKIVDQIQELEKQNKLK